MPGGAEFPGNNLDDDCDTEVDEVTICPCTDDDSDDRLLQGLGLCDENLANVDFIGLPQQRDGFVEYGGVEPRTQDGCVGLLSSGLADVDAASTLLEFDPFATVSFDGTIQFAVDDEGASFTCTFDGAPYTPCASPLTLPSRAGPGQHVFVLTATDAEYNIDPHPLTSSSGFADGPAPVEQPLQVLFPTEGGRSGERSPTISGLASSGAYLTLRLTSETSDEEYSTDFVLVEDDGTWAIPTDAFFATLDRGAWTLVVESESVSDSDSNERVEVNFFVEIAGGDNVPPSSVVSAFDREAFIDATEDEVFFFCTLDGLPVDCDFGDFELPEGLTGRHVLTVSATDVAGNTELSPAVVYLDAGSGGATVPLSLRSPEDGSTTSQTRPTIIGTASSGSSVVVDVGDNFSVTTYADSTGRFVVPSFLMDELAAGTYEIRASTFDWDTLDEVVVTSTFTVDPTSTDTTPPAVVAMMPSFFGGSPIDTNLNRTGVDPSTGESINDPSGVVVTLDVPANARGFELDLMFISTEWPEYLCQVFNDAFKVIVESGAVANGEPTNVAFDTSNNPLTVNVGFFEQPSAWTTNLADVPHVVSEGYQICPDPEFTEPGCALPTYCDDADVTFAFGGSGSGWLKTRAPVQPGEQLRITFLLYDLGDNNLDSIGILDGFRWLAEAPPIETVKEP